MEKVQASRDQWLPGDTPFTDDIPWTKGPNKFDGGQSDIWALGTILYLLLFGAFETPAFVDAAGEEEAEASHQTGQKEVVEMMMVDKEEEKNLHGDRDRVCVGSGARSRDTVDRRMMMRVRLPYAIDKG